MITTSKMKQRGSVLIKNDKKITHKKPIDLSPSKILAKFAEEIAMNSNGTIVDVPCGYGRNAACIASFGVPVLCVDINNAALEYIESSVSLSLEKSKKFNRLTTMQLDLINDPWPFEDESLGAIINVHFFHRRLIGFFLRSLKIGGYLFIETIGGQRGNYPDLPPYGFIKAQLREAFDIKFLKEKKVALSQSNSATVKLLAIKQKTYQ
jgi:SAM-dependent methyltransferase